MPWAGEDAEWAEGAEEYDDGPDEPEADTLPCPSCGQMVFDDTDRCPHCGDWIMPLAASAGRKSRLWIVAAILALIAMLFWAL